MQSLYRALKKAPATHKLGAIYVIDSVVRRWIEQAKQHGQDLNIEGRGEPGTYSAAVKRVTELMPALFDDTFKGIPPEQKEKLEGMIKIWDKGNTFPAKMLQEFKAKLSGENNKAAVQTNGAVGREGSAKKMVSEKFSAPVPSRPVYTPIGYPPQYLYDQGLIPRKADQVKVNGTARSHERSSQAPPPYTPQQQPAPAQPSQDVNSILAALASLPKPPPQQQQPAPVPQPPAPQQPNVPTQLPANLAALFGQQNGFAGMQAPPPQLQAPTYQQPQPQQTFQLPQGFPGFPPPPPSVPQPYAQAQPPPQPAPVQQQPDILAPLRSILPPNILNDQGLLLKALQLLQELQKEGLPMDQWRPIMQAFTAQHQPAAAPAYDRYGRGRTRSRSPERNAGRRRASPVYGNYEDLTTRKQGNGDRAQGGRNRYRERSPIRNSPAPVHGNVAMNGMPMRPKYVGRDNNLPAGCIKVLSRTLFVGGATGTQHEIETLFSRFGVVQTIVANRDKRHAFVKMSTRAEALLAKRTLEDLQNANDKEIVNVARQTKWGVGFGPRECCDYTTGESTIPIHKLTDADMKWMLTAEYGGTGGVKLEPGMVVEEPDIEIGAGVSSKAMSKRVLPETSAPPSKRQHREDGGQKNGGGRDRERSKRQNDGGGYGYGAGGPAPQQPPQPMQMEYGYLHPEPVAVAAPPPVPGFGFNFSGAGQYR